MVAEWKLGGLMLISTHAMHATLPAPFITAGWQQATTTSFGTTNVNSVAVSDAGKLVAVGSSGKIATSTDSGINWTQQVSPFQTSNIYSVAYGDGIYLAGGSTGKMARSVDGENWVLVPSTFGASAILGIAYLPFASLWVAVGASGKLATSLDGNSWLQRASSFGTTFINSVYSAADIAIAVGYDGKLATSNNGVDWTQRGSSFVTSTIYDVVADPSGTEYVAVGDSGKVAVSSNATTWAQIFPTSSFGSSSIRAVAAFGDSYTAAASAGKIGTALEPDFWTQRDSTFGLSAINDVLIYDNIGIAVGNDGKIAYSA